MSETPFAQFNLEAVDTNMASSPLTDGLYNGYVEAAKIIDVKGKKALIMTYKVEDVFNEFNDETIDDFRYLPIMNQSTGEYQDSDSERNAKFLKILLQGLGIDQSVMNKVELPQLIGLPITWVVGTSKDGRYRNCKNIKLRHTLGSEANIVM